MRNYQLLDPLLLTHLMIAGPKAPLDSELK